MSIKLERPYRIYQNQGLSCPDYDVGDVIMIAVRNAGLCRRVTIVGNDGDDYRVCDRWNHTYPYPRAFVYGRIPVQN
jgi:hypothetical protein